MHKLDSEKYYGNIEYKQELSNMDHNKIQKYASQMKFRLQEGNGTAIYYIGIQDDGNVIGVPNELIKSYKNIINRICSEINSEMYDLVVINAPKIKHSIMIARVRAHFQMNSIFYLPGD